MKLLKIAEADLIRMVGEDPDKLRVAGIERVYDAEEETEATVLHLEEIDPLTPVKVTYSTEQSPGRGYHI